MNQRNKLWAFMPTFAHAPPPRPSKEEMAYPPREISDADLQPLRIDAQWRPVRVLGWFGPARHDHEYLARLIVASAVLQGVHRILELAERLTQLINIQYPRVVQMLKNDSLASKKPQLEELEGRLQLARYELPQTRARAANDIDGEPLNPDGLRVMDLEVLKTHTQMCIIGHELTSRRNVTGIDYGLAVAINVPSQHYAEGWLDRALGSSEMNGLLLFTPPDYGRPIIVYDDGRLAYDPAQALDGEGVEAGDDDPYGEYESYEDGGEDDLY